MHPAIASHDARSRPGRPRLDDSRPARTKILLCLRAHEGRHVPVAALAIEFGVSARTIQLWLARARAILAACRSRD